MKKNLTIYLAALMLAFSGVSCSDDDENYELSSNVALRSFSLGTLRKYFTTEASDGSDSTAVTIVSGSLYPFVINQKTFEVYNPDSLPMGTDITRATTGLQCDGVAYTYVDSLQTYMLYSSYDSLDLSKPLRVLVASTDGTAAREYVVRVNKHTVEPDDFYWQSAAAPAIVSPQKAVLWNGAVYLFGRLNDGTAAQSATATTGTVDWSTPSVITTLPATVDFNTVQLFGGRLYAVADEALYVSANGTDWSPAEADGRFTTLFAASDATGRMWAVKDGSLAYTADGATFTTTSPLPANFPTKNISSAVYPLRTNGNILRSVLIGNVADDETQQPTVWSKLSTEQAWGEYSNEAGSDYNCPALADLTALYYDDNLYAFGGAGVIKGTAVAAFESLYVSYNQGLVWDVPQADGVSLPAELAGTDAPYAALTDDAGRIWIIVGGESPTVWRGGFNRLSF